MTRETWVPPDAYQEGERPGLTARLAGFAIAQSPGLAIIWGQPQPGKPQSDEHPTPRGGRSLRLVGQPLVSLAPFCRFGMTITGHSRRSSTVTAQLSMAWI